MTFETFLMQKCDAKDPDTFEFWLSRLDPFQWIDSAEEWHKEELTNNKKEK